MTIEEFLTHKHWAGDERIVRISHLCKIKSPVTNVWLDGVGYIAINGYTGAEIYVRSLVDFLEVFKPHSILEKD